MSTATKPVESNNDQNSTKELSFKWLKRPEAYQREVLKEQKKLERERKKKEKEEQQRLEREKIANGTGDEEADRMLARERVKKYLAEHRQSQINRALANITDTMYKNPILYCGFSRFLLKIKRKGQTEDDLLETDHAHIEEEKKKEAFIKTPLKEAKRPPNEDGTPLGLKKKRTYSQPFALRVYREEDVKIIDIVGKNNNLKCLGFSQPLIEKCCKEISSMLDASEKQDGGLTNEQMKHMYELLALLSMIPPSGSWSMSKFIADRQLDIDHQSLIVQAWKRFLGSVITNNTFQGVKIAFSEINASSSYLSFVTNCAQPSVLPLFLKEYNIDPQFANLVDISFGMGFEAERKVDIARGLKPKPRPNKRKHQKHSETQTVHDRSTSPDLGGMTPSPQSPIVDNQTEDEQDDDPYVNEDDDESKVKNQSEAEDIELGSDSETEPLVKQKRKRSTVSKKSPKPEYVEPKPVTSNAPTANGNVKKPLPAQVASARASLSRQQQAKKV